MADIQELDRVMDHITKLYAEGRGHLHNQAHYQKTTDCGTSHCFAGWAIALDTQQRYHFASNFTEGWEVWASNGVSVDTLKAAADVLDLTGPQAFALFIDAQTYDDLLKTLERIKRNEI